MIFFVITSSLIRALGKEVTQLVTHGREKQDDGYCGRFAAHARAKSLAAPLNGPLDYQGGQEFYGSTSCLVDHTSIIGKESRANSAQQLMSQHELLKWLVPESDFVVYIS